MGVIAVGLRWVLSLTPYQEHIFEDIAPRKLWKINVEI